MNKNIKYCHLFLLFTIVLILATSISFAADNNTVDNKISDNLIDQPVNDNYQETGIDNNDNILSDDKTSYSSINTTTKSSYDKIGDSKEKSIKKAFEVGKLSVNQSSGIPGDDVTITLTVNSITSLFAAFNYNYNISLDGNIIASGTYKPTTNKKAVMSFTVPQYEPGTYELFIEFVNKSNGANGSTSFTVEEYRANTQIIVDEITGVIGNIDVPISVVDSNGNAITGESSLTIKDGENELVSNVPIYDGNAIVSVPFMRGGQYPITIIFNENNEYISSEVSTIVDIRKWNSSLVQTMFNTQINAIENTVVKGQLKSTNNEGICNSELTVEVNGVEDRVFTDDNGNFEYKFVPSQVDLDIPIKIYFKGNDLYNISVNVIEGTFDVKNKSLKFTLDSVDYSEVDEYTTITGKVYDNDNNLVAGATLNLTISSLNENITVISDNNGVFKYDIIFDAVQNVIVTASRDSENGLYIVEDDSVTFSTIQGLQKSILSLDIADDSNQEFIITDVTPCNNVVLTEGILKDKYNNPIDNAIITVLINDELLNFITDDEGKFTITYYANYGLTDYNIIIKYEGNETFKASKEIYTGKFTTTSININIFLEEVNTYYILNQTVLLTGFATIGSEPYKNQEILLNIDKKNYTVITNSEGRFNYEYIVSRTGVIQFGAAIDNPEIVLTNNTRSITCIKPNVSLYLDDISDGKVLSEIILTGRLLIETNQTPIQSTFNMSINGKIYQVSTDENGLYSYSFIPEKVGLNNITVTYNNNSFYTIHNDTKLFNISQLKTKLINDNVPLSIKVGDYFVLSGLLLDENDNPLSHADIQYIINGNTYITKTSDNGSYSYKYLTTTVGDNNIYEVRYGGNYTYDVAREYIGSFFDVEKILTTITVEADDTNVKTPTVITGTVKNQNDEELNNINVILNINGEEFTTTTANNGEYIYEYTPIEVGDYNVKVKVDDNNYSSYTKQTTFTAMKSKENTIITVNPVKSDGIHETTLIANIVDTNNNPVTGGKVIFKINGVSIKDENAKLTYSVVNNGVASATYSFTKKQIEKNSIITAVYSGYNDYLSSRSEGVIVVLDEESGIAKIKFDDITASSGQTITLKVEVKDNDENINTGKVAFKVNGKTVKDDNGKVLYATVENGFAIAEYTIPSNYKSKKYDITAIFTSSIYDRTESQAILTIVDTNSLVVKNNIPRLVVNSGNVIIVNNDTIDDVFSGEGYTLSDEITTGSILDFQGNIFRNHSIIFNKPVNVISSTNDAVISLNTTAGSLMGEDPGNSFIVKNGASYSNFTGLYLNNTQFWASNVHYVTFDNMSMVVNNSRVGSGVGQTAIRDNSTYVTLKNSLIYTKDNGGSSSLVLTYASHCTLINNTIVGVGLVGNLLYLNVFNAAITTTEGNSHNIIANNTIIGPENAADICDGIRLLSAKNNTVENNTINYTGSSIVSSGNNIIRFNKIYNGRLSGVTGGILANNTVYNGTFIPSAGIVENNTVYGYMIINYNNTKIRNNVAEYVNITSNYVFGNNTVLKDVDLDSCGKNVVHSNIVIDNATIYGNIIAKASSIIVNNVYRDYNIKNSFIGGNIIFNITYNVNITNNIINGSIIIEDRMSNVTIANNVINTTNDMAVLVYNESVTVKDNYIESGTQVGNKAVFDNTTKATISNNLPEKLNASIEVPNIEELVLNDLNMTFALVTSSDNSINSGHIYLLINDEAITDNDGNIIKLDVVDNKAVLNSYNIPRGWLRSDVNVTVVFNESKYYNSLNHTINIDISKRLATVELLSKNIIVDSQKVTLQAKVTDYDNIITTGRVAFKLNGNTLQDNNGNLIFVDVIDGFATLEYVIPDYITSDTYELTVVFEDMLYYRSTDTATLIVE